MKKALFSFIFALLLFGCGPAVKHTVSPEFQILNPRMVAVMPLVWEDKAVPEADGISLLFRQMASEKLSSLEYSTVPLETVDRAGGPGWFDKKPAHEVASVLGADSVLYIRILDWDNEKFTTYRALKISAAFELHSATGQVLWTAAFSTSEADAGLDKAPMELALHKAYEPRVQRLVDAVFTTMPSAEASESRRKTYYQWLP